MQVTTLISWGRNKDVSGAEKQLLYDIEQPMAVLTSTVVQAPARTGALLLGRLALTFAPRGSVVHVVRC